jgi:hypothetical protein
VREGWNSSLLPLPVDRELEGQDAHMVKRLRSK